MHMGERDTHREKKRKKKGTHVEERERKRFGSSFYMFFLPLGLPYAN